MPWRNWRVLVVVLLANYMVFALLGTVVFPESPVTAPTHAPRATFTRGVIELRNVGTLTYDFLTPTATATFVGTPTITLTPTPTLRATTAPTSAIPATTAATPAASATTVATRAMTLAATTAATRASTATGAAATPALTVIIIKPGN